MIYKDKEYKTFGELFNLALKLAKENPVEANEWLVEYIGYIAHENTCDFEKASRIAKSNLGYFAGYYDQETCDIIYKTYQCSHPIFGDKPFEVDPEEAYKKGLEMGKKLNKQYYE